MPLTLVRARFWASLIAVSEGTESARALAAPAAATVAMEAPARKERRESLFMESS